MYTYICCRCTNCAARIALEEWADSGYLPNRPPRPRPGREACPYCRAVFVAERYYVTESGSPLLQRGPKTHLKGSAGAFTQTA
jgi:hypothetical protein